MGDLAANEVWISPEAWRANGGKIMRRIHETLGEDCYRLRFWRFADLNELCRVVISFRTAEEAMVYKLIAERQHHAW